MDIDPSILQFVKSQNLCVLSTVTADQRSESAVMAYTVDDHLLFFLSSEPETRKIKNIAANPHVSLVIGGLNHDPTIQIDGHASLLSPQETKTAKAYMLKVHPELKNYLSPDCIFFTISPHWLRFSDFSQNPPLVSEAVL